MLTRMASLLANNVHFLVPFGQNESFVGRKAILDQLLARVPPRAHTNACQRTVVEGLGGVGKTQVAIETAYRVRDAHPDCSIFWLPAVNMDMFKNAYREMGRALGVPDMDGDKGDFKAAVKTALSHSGAGQWLLIVDNIDDPALLENHQLMSYIPSGQEGSVLFTTRYHRVAVDLDARQA